MMQKWVHSLTTTTCLTAAIWAGAMPTLAQENNQLTAPIDQVTLYQTGNVGATVIRKAEVSVPKGISTVTIDGLLRDIDFHPIFADPTITILETERAYYIGESQNISAQKATLGKQLQEVQDTIGSLTAKMRGVRVQLNAISRLALDDKMVEDRPTLDDPNLSEYLAKLADKTIKLAQVYEQLGNQQAKVVKHKRRVEEALKALPEEDHQFARLRIKLSAPKAVKTSLKIRYNSKKANWSQGLHASIDSDKKTLTYAMQAMLHQSSGENWADVAVTLAGINRDHNYTIPMPRPEYLGLAQPQNMRKDRGRVESVMAMAAPPLRQEFSRFNQRITLPGRYTMPSRKQNGQAISLQNHIEKGEMLVQLAPQNSEQAFAAFRTTYAGQFPFYGALVSLDRDQTALGSLRWPALIRGESVDLPAGTVKTITVKKVNDVATDGTKGLFDQKRTKQYRYSYHVENIGQAPQMVEVYAMTPTSTDESIKVITDHDMTKATTHNAQSENGLTLWRKELNPNEKWVIKHYYTIQYPADESLSKKR